MLHCVLRYTGKSHEHNIACSEGEVEECDSQDEVETENPKSRKPRAQSMSLTAILIRTRGTTIELRNISLQLSSLISVMF